MNESCSLGRDEEYGVRADENAPVPRLWDESAKTLRGATQIRSGMLPLVSCYGERAVGVSAPAPPLSFCWAERNTFSTVFLSVDRWSAYCCGIGAVSIHDYAIVYVFLKKVKQWAGWRRDCTYSANPGRPGTVPSPAPRRCRCCWRRGCCSCRTGGRYRKLPRPCARCWGR